MAVSDRTDPQTSFVPAFGVWIIHKHRRTGELLGPGVPFGVPTFCVYAAIDGQSWRELTPDEVLAYEQARQATIH